MKKKSILLGMLLSIGSLAFSVNPTDPTLLKIPSIKALSEKVDALSKTAATTSRSGAAEAQANLNAAYTEYVAELKKQKEVASDQALKIAIDKELQIVAEKMAPSSNPAKSK